MILYADTSALVKLYVREPGTNAVRALWREADIVATSVVAYPEAASAFARRCREGDLADAAFERIRQALAVDWPRFATIAVDPGHAAAIAVEHGLRGFDAVHLSAALSLAGGDNGTRQPVFCTFDAAQRRAARDAGLVVVEPDG